MLTLDILISVTNAKIVRIKEMLPEPQEGVRYIISYQYTDEKFLKLFPPVLESYPDVRVIKTQDKGLSRSRNSALSLAQGDLVYFIDDDTCFLPHTIDIIRQTFEQHPESDICLFQAQNYSGAPLRSYPSKPQQVTTFAQYINTLAYEMVCRRDKVQGIVRYDERFGLGSEQFHCYEQQVFLYDALRADLRIDYFAIPVIQTSAIYKPLLINRDHHIQQAMGGLLGYVYPYSAVPKAFHLAYIVSQRSKCSFFRLLFQLLKGIAKVK